MKKICDKNTCTGCAACCAVCPTNSISMEYNEEGFLFPEINGETCINCGKCFKICPNNAVFMHYDDTKFYQVWAKDQNILKASSSGGFFSVLSQFVLKQTGVVFGVYKEFESGKLLFEYAENEKELEKFRFSKYYQAEIGDTYKMVRAFIEKGRLVLFSGTACQIAGLLSYLGGNYNKKLLLTVDVLCHGTPSRKAVNYYLIDKQKEKQKKIDDYQFRIKPNDGEWCAGGSTRIKLYYDDGTSEVQDKDSDTYFMAYNENIILRECCYQCKYCGLQRITDFTMADFWGVNDVPVQQQSYGVGLVLCNSNDAKKHLNELQNEMIIQEANAELAIENNLALVRPNARPVARDNIYRRFEKNGFDNTVHQIFYRRYIAIKIKRLIGNNNFKKVMNIVNKIQKVTH